MTLQNQSILNLIIDAHDPEPPGGEPPLRKGLSMDAQEKWFDALQTSREKLKEEGIPTLIVGINNYSRLYAAGEARDPALVNQLHLTRIAPQSDEDIFIKRYMDAFTDIDQALADPILRKYLEGQREDQKAFHEGIINSTLDKNSYFSRPTLDDHLKTMGVDRVTVMGGMAGFCITDTALSAAMRGLDVTIISDRVLGWEDKTYKQVVWHPNSPDCHKKEITDALDAVIDKPEARGFKNSDRQALIGASNRIKISTFSEYTASLEPPAPFGISRNGPGNGPAP